MRDELVAQGNVVNQLAGRQGLSVRKVEQRASSNPRAYYSNSNGSSNTGTMYRTSSMPSKVGSRQNSWTAMSD